MNDHHQYMMPEQRVYGIKTSYVLHDVGPQKARRKGSGITSQSKTNPRPRGTEKLSTTQHNAQQTDKPDNVKEGAE